MEINTLFRSVCAQEDRWNVIRISMSKWLVNSRFLDLVLTAFIRLKPAHSLCLVVGHRMLLLCSLLALAWQLTLVYVFGPPVSSLDSHRLSRCLISIKRWLHNEINLTVATCSMAIRNCCVAFSDELRGCAAAELRGNIDRKCIKLCDILLVRHSNLGPILHYLGDIAGFLCSWVTLPLFHPNFRGVPIAPDGPCWGQPAQKSDVKLFSKNSNLCDHDS